MRRWFVLIIMVALTSTAPATTLPTVPPVTLTSSWTSVGLPDEPLDVVAHNGQLWVGGANEMIAVSDDAGEHWTVRNENRKGEMLFALVFPAPHKIVAYGSAGVRLVSVDDGKNWKWSTFQPEIGLAQVAQAGSLNVGASYGNFGSSSDSGKRWSFKQLQAMGAQAAQHANLQAVTQVGVLDAQHAVVLFESEKAGQNLAYTADGGAKWSILALDPGSDYTTLRTGSDGYDLYGEHVSDHAVAMAHSSDGEVWRRGTAPPVEYTQCEAPGCLIPGGWVDLTGSTPVRWALPADLNEPERTPWADVGATFCFVRDVLSCRRGRDAWVPGTQSASINQYTPGLVASVIVATPDPSYPASARALRVGGMVVIEGVIGTDGRVHKMVVRAAPSAALARAAVDQIGKKWRFRPATVYGKPVDVPAHFLVSFSR